MIPLEGAALSAPVTIPHEARPRTEQSPVTGQTFRTFFWTPGGTLR